MDSSTISYTTFGPTQRWWIVALVASAGWFSTLSSFIYYPVLPTLARDLHTTIDRINLTITSYMSVSGVAPAIVGDAADMFGRRPLYLFTLGMYLAANIGIALQRSFTALIILRMIQSAGISGTFSIAYGVIADIATPAERGTFVGALSLGITTAPSIGPLLGGGLASAVGWRWIFWFLAITSGVVVIGMALFLPETGRSVVGNGTIPPPSYSRPFLPLIMRPYKHHDPQESSIIHRKKTVPNPLKSLQVLSRKDTAVSITAGSIIYMVYCTSHASLSTVLVPTYGLSQLQAGLVYLPFGLSSLFSTIISGKIMDRDYKVVAKKYNLPIDRVAGDDLQRFPIEEARLRSIIIPALLTSASMIGYGWAVHKQMDLWLPLTLQAVAGFSIQTCFNYNNTLVIDINKEAPATAQASFNMVRCILAAAAVAALQYMINAMGFGLTFTLLGCLCLLSVLLYLLELQKGMQWRVAAGAATSPSSLPQSHAGEAATSSGEKVGNHA
ncbi:major facilitator superfamily domain-containing protein [Lophiotrema nucula]|uniref:Major facilitator superfamily domain-containing protein n=1 Tax=Lophiotrema nucula TaxID=690887 RepID=A0A6A5YHX4_9PLEO|nr:major facilitator superfamily domain-containing protein [Lophiotrema nucula]